MCSGSKFMDMDDCVLEGGVTPYSALYGKAPPEMATFFRIVGEQKGRGQFHKMKYTKSGAHCPDKV